MAVTLKDEKILDSWGMVIENGQGKEGYIFKTTQKFLQEAQSPGVSWQMTEVKTGMLKGLLGKKREYLQITNEALKDYRMYIGARDYGTYLDVSWFVTVEPGFFKKRFSAAMTGSFDALSFNLDVFDNQDLRAYVSVAHKCLLKAVANLMEELHQDFSTVHTKSKGFLEVW